MSVSETHSHPIVDCQVCSSKNLRSLLFLGYVPPVNTMPPVGERAVEQPAFPLELLRCDDCGLVQIGLEVAPEPTAPAAVLSSPGATTAAPPGEAAAAPSQYWVEYGVFTGARAAKRLQQALANQGLDTVITQTHAPDGRALVRVRSSLLDHGAAKAASESARQALKLSALLHRSAAPPAQTVARAAAPSVSQGYWVQFGAFPHRQQAARLQAESLLPVVRGSRLRVVRRSPRRVVRGSPRQPVAAARRHHGSYPS